MRTVGYIPPQPVEKPKTETEEQDKKPAPKPTRKTAPKVK